MSRELSKHRSVFGSSTFEEPAAVPLLNDSDKLVQETSDGLAVHQEQIVHYERTRPLNA